MLTEVEKRSAHHEHESGTVLEINSVISAAAGLYEKIRYLVDYREEHTIRRAAIERILKRHVLIEKKSTDGATLLQELVESQYLPAEAATEHTVHEIDHTIHNFLNLQILSGRHRETAGPLLSLAASEIESFLSTHEFTIDAATAEALYKVVRPHIVLAGVPVAEVDVQVFAAARRALLSSDDAALRYALWLMSVPEWHEGEIDFEELAGRLKGILSGIEYSIADPLQWQIAPRIKNESIYFRLIRELLMQHDHDAEEVLSNEKKLDAFVRSMLEKKYAKENERIKRSGIRAVVYLFVTKMVVALLLEAPYESFFLGEINYVTLAINGLFHPTLLFVLTRRVRALGESNTQAVIKGMHRVVYQGGGKPIHVYARYTRFTPFFGLFYMFLVLGIFGAIITVLQMLDFSAVGMILFLFFLALVSYFAYRIRSNARRWRVSGGESTITLVSNMLAVPVIRVGRWLSRTFSSINVFVMIMDFLIETPFRLILNFSHQFILYLREKADEVY